MLASQRPPRSWRPGQLRPVPRQAEGRLGAAVMRCLVSPKDVWRRSAGPMHGWSDMQNAKILIHGGEFCRWRRLSTRFAKNLPAGLEFFNNCLPFRACRGRGRAPGRGRGSGSGSGSRVQVGVGVGVAGPGPGPGRGRGSRSRSGSGSGFVVEGPGPGSGVKRANGRGAGIGRRWLSPAAVGSDPGRDTGQAQARAPGLGRALAGGRTRAPGN